MLLVQMRLHWTVSVTRRLTNDGIILGDCTDMSLDEQLLPLLQQMTSVE